MSNYVLGYRDIGYQASYAGGIWRDDLDSKMLNRQLLTAVARTLGLDDLLLDITLNQSIDIQVLGICNHNISSNGTYKWTAYSDSDRLVEVYNSGEITPYSYLDSIIHKTTCDIIDNPITTAFWRLEITDSNADGYIQLGRLFIGQRFTTGCNMNYGLKLGVDVSNTIIEESTVGIEAIIQAINIRTAAFSHSLESYDSGTEFLAMQLREGVSEVCLFEFNPESKDGGLRTFIGRHSSVSPLDYPSFNVNNFNFQIKEIL